MIGTFVAGAALYPCIELMWRGRTHPSMAFAGGAGLCWLRWLARHTEGLPLWIPAIAGGTGITAMEYLLGVTLNKKYNIWDYRKKWKNIRGQICPAFALAWCGLSALAVRGMRGVRM
ncbi:MAG: hypothetical protein E7331_10540 [Clostridiales bacterium]|nr:hypothetical protein [Clostridiales bacterium]